MAVYAPIEGDQIYVRKQTEFESAFEIVEDDD